MYHQNDGWTMAGRVRVFSLTLWLRARAWAYSREALAVARATAAVQACTILATCEGVMNVKWRQCIHDSWWNLGASRPAAICNVQFVS